MITNKAGKKCSALPGVNCLCPSPENSSGVHALTSQDMSDNSWHAMKQTEDLIASGMSKLTVEELSEAMDDLHCVGEDLEETPEIVERSLAELNRKVQEQQNSVYEIAARQNRAYLENPSFRLKFLRANMHNVGQSVTQMMNFLKIKAKYFGDDKVARDITVRDLNAEDIALLSSGLYYVQTSGDRNGRVILYLLSKMFSRCKRENFSRVVFYVYFNVLSVIPEVQMKGLNFVVYDNMRPEEKVENPTNWLSSLSVMDVVTSMPIRFSSMHFCLKARKETLAVFNSLLGMSSSLLPLYSRVRTRLHGGSDMELQYQLKRHGININAGPIDEIGNLRTNILNAWLNDHLEKEAMSSRQVASATLTSPSPVPTNMNASEAAAFFTADFEPLNRPLNDDIRNIFTEVTANVHAVSSSAAAVALHRGQDCRSDAAVVSTDSTERDVLLGRGRLRQEHKGNIRFREFVEGYYEEYNKTPRQKRGKIVKQLASTLRAEGVRFLKERGNVWVEGSGAEAEKKIGQLLREFRKKK